jgi:hypothetical protein
MQPVPHAELVPLGGGAARPLTAAVTVVGAGPGCDLPLTDAGVEPVHCLLAATPAGLAVRSLCPDRTRVNGAATAARLLADGDALEIGPVAYVVRIPDELVTLVPAPPELVQDQDAALAELVCARTQQFARWQAELADRREEVRQLKARIHAQTDAAQAAAADKLSAADRLANRLADDRARVRRLAVRFTGRLRRKYAADHAALTADRRALKREAERFHADAAGQKERLARAWELLKDGQKRLVADRQAADAQVAAERAALDARAAEVDAESAAREQNQRRCEDRVGHLLAEIARLDARAAAGRAAVEKLERQRGMMQPAPVPAGPLAFPDRVPLVLTPAAAAHELLGQLAVRDTELARAEAGLDRVRQELVSRAAALHDDRLVLAEQLAVLAHARQVWQATECQIVAELEGFARELSRHEMALAARERQVSARENAARTRTAELDAARGKLEGWLTLLSGYEAQAVADRDRLLADAAAQRARLAAWEGSLGGLTRRWADEHETLTRELRTEIAGWQRERTALATAVAGLDAERIALAERAAEVAAHAVANQDAARLAAPGPQAERQLRVLRAGWERRFKHAAQDLDARRRALAADLGRMDLKCRELGRAVGDAADRLRVAVHMERQAEADRLARGRELDDRAAALAADAARADITRRELAEARSETDALARRLIGDDAPGLPAAGSRLGLVALAAA